jgi:hypothetical protein
VTAPAASRVAARSAALLGLAALAGCAHSYRLSAGDGYSRDSAYIYGRFTIDGISPLWYQLRCRDGNSYKIQFSQSSAVKVFRIAPSICQVDYVVFGNETQNEMVGFRLLRNEVLDPGGVYYVGDFTADSTWKWIEGIVTWIIKGRRNEYAKTTEQLKKTFPAFSSVATEDRVPR